MNRIINKLKKELSPSNDYIYKKISIKNNNVYLVFSEVLCSSSDINDFILKRLLILSPRNLNNITDSIPSSNIIKIMEEDIYFYLNNGFLIYIFKSFIYAIEMRQVLERGITTIESEISTNGPKDSFSENFNTNLGLIKKRIKSKDLKWKEYIIGRYSKTKIGLLYIDDICNKDIIKQIEQKLSKIDIDGIIDSSYLKDILEDNNNSFFPTIMSTERPDKVSMSLLEGKVSIIVDMSSYVLILPNFFIDFFHTVDDYYQKSLNTTFIRIVRLISFFISIFLPAYYIAIITYNQDSIPLNLLLLLKAQKFLVPFPAIIEAIFMIISFEILRESDIRMSSTTGTAISILGGLILGDAAVNAGIMSPIMIIVIALSSIAGFVFTNIELINAVRIYRIIFIALASLLGLYGIYLGGIYLLYKLITLTSLTKPYLIPFSPFIRKAQLDAIYKDKNVNTKYRNTILSKNIIRGRYK